MRLKRVFGELKAAGFLLAAAATLGRAQGADLTWSELAQRPEFWPQQCTLQEALALPGGSHLPPGHTVNVIAVRGQVIEVETLDGTRLFAVKPEGTDVLASALQAWRTLTPEQRALTYGVILQRKDLWPYRVRLVRPVRSGAAAFKPGESCILKTVEGGDLLLRHERSQSLFHVPPGATDLIAASRQLIVRSDAMPGRVTQDLAGKLSSPVTGAGAPLPAEAEPRLYAFYRGAAWCEPCRAFSPTLLEFYRKMKPKYPEFEVIYVSADRSAVEMAGYAREAGFPWRALAAARQPELQIVDALFTTAIPQLIVTDRHGNVLVNSLPAGPQAALKQLDFLLRKSTGSGAGSRP